MPRFHPSPPHEISIAQGGAGEPFMPAQIDRSVHKIKGVGAVPGGAVGPAFVYVRQQLQVPQRSIPMEEVPAELQRYDHAMTTADQELRSLFEEAKKQDFGKDGNTLRFQFEMLKELSPAVRKLVGQGANAEAAVDQVFGDWIRKFQAMATDDFRLKANDIADVRSRMLRKLLGISEPTSPSFTDGPVVLVASVLEPSEAFTLSSSKILAVCTDGGGARDHTAVICRHRGIPVVAGLADLSRNLAQGQELAVDAFNGVVTINPDESVKAALLATMRLNEVRFKSKPLTKGGSATRDGTSIAIVANVESLHDVTRISKTALQGVGLFRSEFLFLSRDTPPSEDEQYAVFLAAAQALGKRPLTIRTMDFGDDKWPQWDTTRQRLGPDVTYSPKGIRLSLASEENEAIFRTHCRAILRASTQANVRVMFPSINDAEEFQQALDIFYSEMRGLVRMGVSLNEEIAVGSMIETPSAVFSAEHLAQVASFFSIGTNDLTQSFLGIGRRSSLIGHGFDEAHPVIIRAIRDTCRVAKDRGIPVSVCGDAASDSLLAPLLLGAGVRIFSVAEPNAGQVNHLVGHCEVLECERLVSQIIDDAPGVAKSRALLSEYLGTLRKRAGLE